MRSFGILSLTTAAALASPAQAQVFGQTDVGSVVEDPVEVAEPLTNPGSWVSTYDYPASALRAEVEGTTAFTLIVGIDGKPLQCEVTKSSGSADLDSTSCEKLLERASFAPARDDDGEAVASTFRSAVRWEIPSHSEFSSFARTPPGPVSIITSFVVEKDGSVSDCKTERSEGGEPSNACAFGTAFEPFRDEDGNPVRRRVRTTIEVVHEDVPQ